MFAVCLTRCVVFANTDTPMQPTACSGAQTTATQHLWRWPALQEQQEIINLALDSLCALPDGQPSPALWMAAPNAGH